jgi:hypothetical protein
MWDLMAILAAVCFLFDVAVRRIAIDWQGARKEVRDAMSVRAAGDGTVAAWRKAREQRGAREVSPEASASMRRTLEEGPALDVRRDVREGGAGVAPKPASSAPDGSTAAGADEDTTSRLLRAKRRATRDNGEDDGGGDPTRGGSAGQ